MIKRVPLFSGLSKRELEAVAAIADEVDLREGKELTTQGRSAREFFVLLEGSADVSKDGRRINQLSDGDFFGEIALISHSPRTATVTTTTPVRALVITDRSFRRILEGSQEIQLKVLEALAERLAPETI